MQKGKRIEVGKYAEEGHESRVAGFVNVNENVKAAGNLECGV